MNDRRTVALAALLALVPFAWLVAHFWWTCDDAFISFRYVKHLARGDGLIFNPGESPPVEGFSNLLWILAQVPTQLAGGSVAWGANVLSALCGFALLVLVLRFASRRLELDGMGLAATGLFLATLPPFAIWSTSGLETMPFALAVFATYTALAMDPQRPRPLLAAAFAIAAALLRADGALWCGFAFCAALVPDCLIGRWKLLRPILIAGALLTVAVGLHFLWRNFYFGEWMPNTAKIKAGYTSLRGERGFNYLVSFWLAAPSVAVVMVLSSWAPIVKSGRHAVIPSALVFVLACFGYAIYVGGDFMAMGRFVVPSLPFIALLFAALCRTFAHKAAVATWGVLAVALGLLSCFDRLPVDSELRQKFHFRWNGPTARSEVAQWEFMKAQAELWSDLGRALNEHTEAGESLIRGNIGATGFHSELVLLDQNGLVIPEVAESSQPLKRASPGHDRRVEPKFFASRKPTYFSASLAPKTSPLGAGLGTEAIQLLQAGRLSAKRFPLEAADGYPKGSELRLLRFNWN